MRMSTFRAIIQIFWHWFAAVLSRKCAVIFYSAFSLPLFGLAFHWQLLLFQFKEQNISLRSLSTMIDAFTLFTEYIAKDFNSSETSPEELFIPMMIFKAFWLDLETSIFCLCSIILFWRNLLVRNVEWSALKFNAENRLKKVAQTFFAREIIEFPISM